MHISPSTLALLLGTIAIIATTNTTSSAPSEFLASMSAPAPAGLEDVIANDAAAAAAAAATVVTSTSTPASLPRATDTEQSSASSSGESAHHKAEKKSLLKRLSMFHGTWDTNHPRARLLDALWGFRKYREMNIAQLQHWWSLYGNVPQRQKKVLEAAMGYTQKIDAIEERINQNGLLCEEIVASALKFYQIEETELQSHIKGSEELPDRKPDRISVSQALKHIVRDWSDQGRSEREDAFPCILGVLRGLFPDRSELKSVRALLPGAGPGRLGYEVAALGGFEVTSNEWWAYNNIAYRYLSARPPSAAPKKRLHPFIDSFSHHATTANMLRSVIFPAYNDSKLPLDRSSAVVLVEGDFTTAFAKNKEQFDVIVTHFFIDTARNLMNYLDTIHALLPKGGSWVNFGPLLWGSGPWVQLSLDEVIAVVKAVGFEFVKVPAGTCPGNLTLEGELVRSMKAVYGLDERTLTRNAYAAQVWIARKM